MGHTLGHFLMAWPEGVVPKNWLTLKGNEYYVHLPPGTVSEIDNLACTSTPPSKDTWQMQFCIVEQTSGKFIINHILYEACLKIWTSIEHNLIMKFDILGSYLNCYKKARQAHKANISDDEETSDILSVLSNRTIIYFVGWNNFWIIFFLIFIF